MYEDQNWKDLTDKEQSDAQKHMEESFGERRTAQLLREDKSHLVTAHNMRAHMAQGMYDEHEGLPPLNPAPFGLSADAGRAPRTHSAVEAAKMAKLNAQGNER